MRPEKESFVKFSIDGVKLRDVERFDQLAKDIFPTAPNPRKKLFYNSLFLARAMREIAAGEQHGEQDETDQRT